MAENIWEKEVSITEQNRNYFKSGMKNLWQLIATEAKNLKHVLVLMLIIESLCLVNPIIFKEIFELLVVVKDNPLVALQIATLIGALFLMDIAVLRLFRMIKEPKFFSSLWNLENIWPVMTQEKLLSLSIDYHNRTNTGKMTGKMTKGNDRMVNILCNLSYSVLNTVFYMIMNTVVLFFIDWRLAFLTLLPLYPAMLVQNRMILRLHQPWEQWHALHEQATGMFCESLICVDTVKAYCQEGVEIKRHQRIRDEMTALDIKNTIIEQAYLYRIELFLRCGFLSLCALAAYFCYTGTGTVGTIIYVIITGNATMHCMKALLGAYSKILRDLVSVDRLHGLMQEQPTVQNQAPGKKLQTFDLPIRFEHVWYTYPVNTSPSLEDVNITLTPGMMIALVGESGAGKTTLSAALAREFDPTQGRITLGGVDIRDLDIDWYRSRIALMLQQPQLFDSTLEYNIRYGHPDATNEQVVEVVKAARLDELVRTHPRFAQHGLQTLVGKNGVMLSGGQSQRVALARTLLAIHGGARLAIFDEPTSNVDPVTENGIVESLNVLRKRAGVVVIAHRLSTVQGADMIIVMHNGRIVECGTHQVLLVLNGVYAGMVQRARLAEKNAA